MKKEINNFQKHENGRNQAILEFYRGIKKNPHTSLARILKDIIEKYGWMCEYYKSSAIGYSYAMGFFGELHFMIWMAEEKRLKVNQDILDKI